MGDIRDALQNNSDKRRKQAEESGNAATQQDTQPAAGQTAGTEAQPASTTQTADNTAAQTQATQQTTGQTQAATTTQQTAASAPSNPYNTVQGEAMGKWLKEKAGHVNLPPIRRQRIQRIRQRIRKLISPTEATEI
jgi:hypothetical protein